MRDFFRHNLGLKLISLGLAIGLWQVVRHDPVGGLALDVPIEFRNIPENMEISTESIPRAEIRLSGPDRLLRNLSRAEVHAVIDVGSLKPGERTFDLNSAEIRRPRGLASAGFRPAHQQESSGPSPCAGRVRGRIPDCPDPG
jgi:hypothetical protein